MLKSAVGRVVSLLALIAGCLTVIMFGLMLSGYRPFVLMSPSMEPLYQKGSLSWIDTKVEPGDLKIGDVVVARLKGGSLILHRLVGENLLQGDANPNAQELVLDRTNLVGREAFTIQGLGEVIPWLIGKKWLFYTAGVLIALLACVL